jgi:hypothetical protein
MAKSAFYVGHHAVLCGGPRLDGSERGGKFYDELESIVNIIRLGSARHCFQVDE